MKNVFGRCVCASMIASLAVLGGSAAADDKAKKVVYELISTKTNNQDLKVEGEYPSSAECEKAKRAYLAANPNRSAGCNKKASGG